MNIGDHATYYPGRECDQGVVAERNRGGCHAVCIARSATGPAGRVDLEIVTRDGKRLVREGVPVILPPEYDPPFPSDAVDPPHGEPYCRPME
jgi:hypothetical protein